MKNFFKWSSTRELGNSRILKSSYYWVIFVPIISKIINHYNLNFDLPFSWKIFYFSSIFVTLGNLFYSLFCPFIIKKFSDFSSFYENGFRDRSIKKLLFDTQIPRKRKKRISFFEDEKKVKLLKDFYKILTGNDYQDNKNAIVTRINDIQIKNEKIGEAFWFIRDLEESKRPFFTFLTLIFYGIGLTGFIYVLLENLIYVINFV